MSPATSRWKRTRALSWRLPTAVAGALALAVLLAAPALIATGSTANLVPDATALGALGLALLPTMALILATTIGLIAGITVVAALVRDTLSGHHGRLAFGWGRAWRTLPTVLGLGALGLLAVALSFLAWPAICIGALVRAGWRMRHAESRAHATKGPRRGLWVAVPLAFTLSLLAALPLTWSALLAGTSLRESLKDAAAAGLRTRAAVVGGLLVLGAASAGTGTLATTYAAARVSDAGAAATSGTVALGVSTAVLIALAGTLLGFLTHTRHDPPAYAAPAPHPAEHVAFASFFRPAAVTGVATMVITALVLPLGIGALGSAASALNFADDDPDFVVTSLIDTPANPNECIDAAPCSLRSAIAKAKAAAANYEPATVRFLDSGTVTLTSTLVVPAGVTITGDFNTLKAGGSFRVLETTAATVGEGAGWVTLTGLTITGGRSAAGGAGLYSAVAGVELREMTFTDNISDAGTPPTVVAAQRHGGAISVPTGNLRVEQSTFEGNYARSGAGGAIYAHRLDLANSTFVDNDGISGRADGGTLYAKGAGSSITHATVIGGGGVSGSPTVPLLVINSAIETAAPGALPCARAAGPNEEGRSVSLGNVDPTGSCFGVIAPLAPLGELADNDGWRTQTVALLEGSAALGAGDSDWCAYADQRGVGRNAARCDAGAFQASADEVPATIDVDLEVTPNPVAYHDEVRMVATVSSQDPFPPGTMRFLSGTDVLAQDVAIDGTERYIATLAAPARGPHQITAEYVTSYGTQATSAPAKLAVQAPSTLALTAQPPATIHAPATITAVVTPDAGAPGAPGAGVAPAPTGHVEFTNGSRTERVEVVDGVATWEVENLQRAYVAGHYLGDDYHGESGQSGPVTTENLPTTTTLTAPATVELGSEVTIEAEVSDGVGTVHGDVRLEVDGANGGSRPLSGGRAAFTLAGHNRLPIGTHTVRVIATPEHGWETSTSPTRTIDVVPAAATITLDQPRELVWSGLHERLGFTLTGEGTATVRLLAGDVVIDEIENADLAGGAGFFNFHIYKTEPGTHTLTAQIVASATSQGATSAPRTLVVTKAPSHIGVWPAGNAVVGQPTSIGVFSRGGGAEGTLALVDGDGNVLSTATMTPDGASLPWTPTSAGSPGLRVTLTPDADSNYLPTSEAVDATIARGYVTEPDMAWTPVPVAGSTALSVDFDDRSVTGSVSLRDTASGDALGWAQVSDGRGVIDVYEANKCYCAGTLELVYSGSGNHHGANFRAPNVRIPAHATTTTLDGLAETVPADSVLSLRAVTRAATFGPAVAGTTTFTVNGTELPAVTVGNGGEARTSYRTTGAGPVSVTARFAPEDSRLAASSAEPVTTTVSALSPPEVTMSTTATPVAGKPFTMNVVADRYGFYIAHGDWVRIEDEDGAGVGYGTWTSTPWGTSAEVSVTPRKGGENVFTAHYAYGNQIPGTSAPLTKTVAPGATKLELTSSNRPKWSGGPVELIATLDRSANPALDAGDMMLVVRADGEPVGDPVKLAAGRSSIPITVMAHRRGSVTYSLTTTGDGVNYGPGTAYHQVTVAGATPIFNVTGDSVIKGRVWKPQLTLTGQPGNPAPTGWVWLTLRGGDGWPRTGCLYEIGTGTGCEVPTRDLPRDRYTVTGSYAGDAYYDGAESTSTLSVFSQRSAIDLELSPSGRASATSYGWQVGEQVTATWKVTDPHHQIPSGSVALTYGDATLCAAPATTTSCTFTAPANPRADAAEGQWGTTVLDATYTPEEALPSTDEIYISAPRRCLPVTAVIEHETVAARTPAPAVTGVTCTMPGPARAAGFLEGTDVTVTTAKLPEHYTVSRWRLEANNAGQLRGPGDGTVVFTLAGATKVFGSVQWAPAQCFYVAASDNRRFRDHIAAGGGKNADFPNPGWVELKTPSNCSSPNDMSVPEREDFDLGIGHYAVGTDVEATSFAWPHRTTKWDPQYKALGIAGWNAPDADHTYHHMVVNKNMWIHGEYAIDPSWCTPLKLYAGIGGEIELLSTKKYFRLFPAHDSGRCLTETGERGYWAFTQLEVRATPEKGFFQNRWFKGDELTDPATRAARLLAEGVADYPVPFRRYDPNRPAVTEDNYNPQTQGFEVPLRRAPDDRRHFGVGFGEVRCVPLDINLLSPVQDAADFTRPEITYTAPNCGNRGGIGFGVATEERGAPYNWKLRGLPAPQMVREYAGTLYYTEGTRVEVTIDETSATPGAEREPQTHNRVVTGKPWLRPGSAARTLTWGSATNKAFADMTTSTAATQRFTMDRPRWLRAQYTPTDCYTPRIRVTPAEFGQPSVDPASSGGCMDGEVDPSKGFIHLRAERHDYDKLEAVWSVGKQREGDYSLVPHQWGYSNTGPTTYVASNTFTLETKYRHQIDLSYCVPLDVAMNIRDMNGNPLDDDARAYYGWSPGRTGNVVDRYLGSAGACAKPRMAVPGSTVQVGLTGEGNSRFVYQGAVRNGERLPKGTRPTMSVGKDWSSEDEVTINVAPRCFTLKLGSKVAPVTKPTCPGASEGNWQYLPGTVVVAKFTGNATDDFHGWKNADRVDEEDKTYAAVRMNQDRTLEANYRSAGGLELVVKIFSNVLQRAVAALVAAVTATTAAILFVAQVGALAVVGVAEGLKALGVEGRGIDVMLNGAAVVRSSIDLVNSVADCSNEWSTGGGEALFDDSYTVGNADADEALGIVTDEVLGQLTEPDTRAAGMLGSAASAYGTVMGLGTGLDAYLSEPSESWANIVDIGGCVRDKGLAVRDAGAQLGRG